MMQIQVTKDGCIVQVKAQPGAKRSGVTGVHNGALKLAVAAPADRGKANKALTELLAKLLGVKKGQVELVGGTTSHDKRFLVTGVSPQRLQEQLESLV